MRILIISSCGKKKKTSPAPAGELYTGQQAQAVLSAVNNLRKVENQVDYYIISARHGLVRADFLLPPYDVSFSGKTAPEINTMAKKLKIRSDLKILMTNKYYDLIYLALGKDYLKAIGDISYLGDHALEVIHFKRKEIEGLIMINEQSLIGQPKPNNFALSVGGSSAAKGRILLNYSIYKITGGKGLFIDWWRNTKFE